MLEKSVFLQQNRLYLHSYTAIMDYTEATKVKKNDILIYNNGKDEPSRVKVLLIYNYGENIRFKVVNKSNNWVHTAHASKFSF